MKEFEIGEKVIVSENGEKKEAVFICSHPLAENFVIVTDSPLSIAGVHHVIQVSHLQRRGKFVDFAVLEVDTKLVVKRPYDSHYINYHLHSVSGCGNFIYVFADGRTSHTATSKHMAVSTLEINSDADVYIVK